MDASDYQGERSQSYCEYAILEHRNKCHPFGGTAEINYCKTLVVGYSMSWNDSGSIASNPSSLDGSTPYEITHCVHRYRQNQKGNILNKFVTIVGGIVEHGSAPRIAKTNFDARAGDLLFDTLENLSCCVFLEGVSTKTRKIHYVLNALLPPDHLLNAFSTSIKRYPLS